jgi:magnesium transporter
MKIDQVIDIDDGSQRLLWVDIEFPSKGELEGIAQQYHLPSHAVQDCLDAEHLPKFERFGNLNFIIVRSFDDQAPVDSDTVQELTRKIAVFESEGFVITIHRREQKFLSELKDDWRTKAKLGDPCKSHLVLLNILRGAIQSYQRPVTENRNTLEEFETKVFKYLF